MVFNNPGFFKVNRFGSKRDVGFKYQSHIGRMTVTCVAMMAKDEQGHKLIDTEILEHNQRWKRGTPVLPQYMAANVSWASQGFMNQMVKIRDQGAEHMIDEKAILNMESTDQEKITSASENYKNLLNSFALL